MSYYSNHDITAYAALRANYDSEQQVWDANKTHADDEYIAQLALYETAHDAWLADPIGADGNPTPEPVPPDLPTYPPAPAPPAPPATTYEAVLATELQQINTATGPALVEAGRYVVTASNGVTFALNENELSVGYTDTTAPLPT